MAAGRPRTHLPTGATLRAFKQVAPNAGDELSAQLVTAARRMARRRWVLRMLAWLLTMALWLSWRASKELDKSVERNYALLLAARGTVTTVTRELESEPYLGIRTAIAGAEKDPDSFSAKWALGNALNVSLPTELARGKVRSPATLGPVTTAAGYRASYEEGRHRVRIDAPTHQVTYVESGLASALAWAPKEPVLAIGRSTGIMLVDARTGVMVKNLRGLAGSATGLSWSSDDELVASDGTFRATWQTHSAKLVAQTGSWFTQMASTSDRSASLAVSRDGSYVIVEGTHVTVPQTIPGASQGGSVGWVGDRWAVGTVDRAGKGALTTLTVDGNATGRIDLRDCQPLWIAPGPDKQTGLVTCARDFGYRTVDLASKRVVRTPMETQSTSIMTGANGDVLVGGYRSELMRVHDGKAEMLGPWRTSCAFGAEMMVPNKDGSKAFVGGQSARSGCAQILHPHDLSRQSTIFLDSPSMDRARAAAWAGDGTTLAVGFASGEVWIFDTEDYFTRQITVPSGAEIRGLAFSADDTSLTAVTREGEVLSIPVTLALADDATRLAEAKRRLQIGVQAGRVK